MDLPKIGFDVGTRGPVPNKVISASVTKHDTIDISHCVNSRPANNANINTSMTALALKL
jgi:hypothetical protein